MYDTCISLYEECALDTGYGVEGNGRYIGRAKNHLRTYTIRKEYKQIKSRSRANEHKGPFEDLCASFHP